MALEEKPPSVSAAEFAILAKRAGLSLNEAQAAVLHGVYGHFEAMLAQLRRPLETARERGAEPALVFVPGQEWAGWTK